MTRTGEILDDIALLGLEAFAGGPGTRKAREVDVHLTYLRDLTPDDIHTLNTTPLGTGAPQLARLRYSHHMLARLIALGKSPAECSALTGHALTTIYRLQSSDQGFMDLVAHYKDLHDAKFGDAASRLAVVGMTAAEELLDRLEDAPEKFTNTQLKEIVTEFIGPAAERRGARGSTNGTGPGLHLTISCVTPKAGTPELALTLDGDEALITGGSGHAFPQITSPQAPAGPLGLIGSPDASSTEDEQ
jgi:hypothetical protein